MSSGAETESRVSAKGESGRIELSSAAQAAARRVAESHAVVPHLLMQARARIPALAGTEAADLVIAAAAAALAGSPRANGSYRDGAIETHSRVNIAFVIESRGVAIAPVIADADGLGLESISAERERLTALADRGELRAPDLSGATFSVWLPPEPAPLTMTPTVAVSQAAALGFGAVEDGLTTLTLASDARALAGSEAAQFLADVVARLTGPEAAAE